MIRPRDPRVPDCQTCDEPMTPVRRAITENGAEKVKTAVCRECGLEWIRGAGIRALDREEVTVP